MKKNIMKKKQSKKSSISDEKRIIFKHDLPLIWVDMFKYYQRTDNSSTLRFFSFLPEGYIEEVRLQTSIKHVKNIIDVLARITDHYPARPEKSAK